MVPATSRISGSGAHLSPRSIRLSAEMRLHNTLFGFIMAKNLGSHGPCVSSHRVPQNACLHHSFVVFGQGLQQSLTSQSSSLSCSHLHDILGSVVQCASQMSRPACRFIKWHTAASLTFPQGVALGRPCLHERAGIDKPFSSIPRIAERL